MNKNDKPFDADLIEFDGSTRRCVAYPSTYREIFLRGTPILDFVTVAFADNVIDEVDPRWLRQVKRRRR